MSDFPTRDSPSYNTAQSKKCKMTADRSLCYSVTKLKFPKHLISVVPAHRECEKKNSSDAMQFQVFCDTILNYHRIKEQLLLSGNYFRRLVNSFRP